MPRPIMWLFKIILSHEKKYACLEIALMLAAGILAPASAVMLLWLIDAVTEGNLWVYPLILYIGMLFAREGILALRRFCAARVLYALGKNMQEETIHKFNRIPYCLFEQRKSRDILEQIAQKPSAFLYELYQNIIMIISDTVSAVGYLFVVGQVHWLLSAGYLFFLLFVIKASFRSMNGMARLYDAQTGEERRMEYLGGLLTDRDALAELKVFQASDYIVTLWKKTAEKVIGQRLNAERRAQAGFGAGHGAGVLWLGILMAVMVRSLMNGRIGLGTFIAVLNGSASLTGLAGALSGCGVSVSRRLSLVNQYMAFEKMTEKERAMDRVQEENSVRRNGKEGIEFQDVSFSYPGSDKRVLEHLSFHIRPGETAALVGENGAGKSTVLKLLCGLYQPEEGRIFLDGQDIRDLDRQELGRRIGVAFQDFERYSLTVRENVALGNRELLQDDGEIRKALKGAMAEEFSACLDQPLGKLKPEGTDLSGGQWQRLAVARALFGGKPYIVLDEPAAAIDPVAESQMYETFRQSLKGRTGIVVSHRLASAAFSDRIFVIHEGKAAESGTHRELLEKNGIYAHMWKVQSRWYREGGEEV